MNSIKLLAHFDGKQIVLDEYFELEPGTKLIVSIMPEHLSDEYKGWLALSKNGLLNAYGEDEIEYSLDSIKEINPDYERR